MVLSLWKRRRSGKKQNVQDDDNKNGGRELKIPSNFVCPISLDLMKDPVMLSTGITYDRDSIEAWIEAGNRTCPLTKQALLAGSDPVPNHAIRQMIQDWCVENADSGVERIATPKAPIASRDVVEILAKIEAAGDELNGEMCRGLVVKLRTAMEESKRNKKRIIANSAGKVLLDIFSSFSKDNNFLDHGSVLDEILTTLAMILPLDAESRSRSANILTDSSLLCLACFMNNGNLPSRTNAVLVLKELLAAKDQTKSEEIGFILEPLVNLVKEPICPAATKAALLSIYYLISKSSTPEKSAAAVSSLGIIPTITEKLVDCDRSVCEKALAVLDGVCISATGRETATNHALTVPVLVKKLHRVSELSTEFSVSVLWKLSKYDEKVVVEALRVGAFQKLLLLLQVGCSETTKEKAGELLKMMNVHKDNAECIESGDFRNLKRTF
ncbi:U-box domain-containing protein 21-like [Ipomoea triloba]|uniref:U-box domain-containing protein 21-like n=1 Tax=Ipomoea triloba TaxID=35885 RepID=UPI00125DA3E7|nr:U-box domain-containing protein 21-like [Ipomoea triloba]